MAPPPATPAETAAPPSSPAVTAGSRAPAVHEAARRRTVGIVAGAAIVLGAMIALAVGEIVSHPRVPASFYVLASVALCTGVVVVFVPWDRMPARWLHAIPVIATIEVAIGVRLAGVYRDFAAGYYIFVVAFVCYAFSSRRAVAAQVAFASVASTLPSLYRNPNLAETAARALIWVAALIVVAGIVTVLREGRGVRKRGERAAHAHERVPVGGP